METWPEPVWELRADVRKLGTLEALGETESGRTHFATPASWSRVPDSELWMSGDASVHLVSVDDVTTERLLPAAEGWSMIGLEFTRARPGSVRVQFDLYGRGGGDEIEVWQELDGGSRCIALAFRFLPLGAEAPTAGEYRWLRIEPEHANQLSSGELSWKWLPSARGNLTVGWDRVAGTPADEARSAGFIRTWSWNGTGSAKLAVQKRQFERGFPPSVEHEELLQQYVKDWPEPVFFLRARGFP